VAVRNSRARGRRLRPWLVAVAVLLLVSSAVVANYRSIAYDSEFAEIIPGCDVNLHEHQVKVLFWLPGADTLPCSTCDRVDEQDSEP